MNKKTDLLLKVGELAQRAGVTVRTLHHYDQIGLLKPSCRSEKGYRLYNNADIAHLQQITALQNMGLSLAEIRDAQQQKTLALREMLARQLQALEQKRAGIDRLLQRLRGLHDHLNERSLPSEQWLQLLEVLTLYEKYFSLQELADLPFIRPDKTARRQALIKRIQAMFTAQRSPEEEEVQYAACDWIYHLEEETCADPALLLRLSGMHDQEPLLARYTNISPELITYIMQAFTESRLNLLCRFLSVQERREVRRYYPESMKQWPTLLARLDSLLAQDVPADAPAARKIAADWIDIFHHYARTPRIRQKLRDAMSQESELRKGSWLTPARLDYLQQALAYRHAFYGTEPE